MFKRPFLIAVALVVTTIPMIAIPVCAQEKAASPTVPVTIAVSVLGPKFTPPPPFTKGDLVVFSGKTRLDVTGWVPAQAQNPMAGLQLAIVIDNSDSSVGVGSQINDLASFIDSQPKTTAVGIFYALNGSVEAAAPFSTDHEAVAQKLRLPMGRGSGTSPSVFLSLDSLVSHWPSSAPGRREALVLTSGVDHLDTGTQDPYLQTAIQHAQEAGVMVHTIFLGGSRFDASFRGDIAESNLSQFAEASGGDAFSEDLNVLLSFAPYLQSLNLTLNNQYLLTFNIPSSNKENGELRPIQIRTEVRDVVLSYPKEVPVPGVAK